MEPTKPISTLARRIIVDGTMVGDGRIVVTNDGRAALIHKNGFTGAYEAAATMLGATWEKTSNTIEVTNGTSTWRGDRDTRCGSCGGRYELRTIDAKPFLPALEPEPAE